MGLAVKALIYVRGVLVLIVVKRLNIIIVTYTTSWNFIEFSAEGFNHNRLFNLIICYSIYGFLPIKTIIGYPPGIIQVNSAPLTNSYKLQS